MTCAECEKRVVSRGSKANVVFVMPGWPNKWKAQRPLPFHRACLERVS